MSLSRRARALMPLLVMTAIAIAPVGRASAQTAASGQKTFASAEEAVAALRAAVAVHDKAELERLFGPQIHELLTGDEKQDKANSKKFAAALAEGAVPIPESADRVIIEVGSRKWPFPIPLVKENSAWRFDTAAGKEEIINRHIGKDELHALGVCEAYVRARSRGGAAPAPKAIHGYVFKILDRQKNGTPTGGFALTAFPEHWGRSGIMTFIVNQDGKIYQRDLGENTSHLAAAMAEYDAGEGWTPVKDKGVVDQ